MRRFHSTPQRLWPRRKILIQSSGTETLLRDRRAGAEGNYGQQRFVLVMGRRVGTRHTDTGVRKSGSNGWETMACVNNWMLRVLPFRRNRWGVTQPVKPVLEQSAQSVCLKIFNLPLFWRKIFALNNNITKIRNKLFNTCSIEAHLHQYAILIIQLST